MCTAIRVYCPVWPKQLLARKLRHGKARFVDESREAHCARCDEFHPADTEFFNSRPKRTGGLDYWCRACREEHRKMVYRQRHD